MCHKRHKPLSHVGLRVILDPSQHAVVTLQKSSSRSLPDWVCDACDASKADGTKQ